MLPGQVSTSLVLVKKFQQSRNQSQLCSFHLYFDSARNILVLAVFSSDVDMVGPTNALQFQSSSTEANDRDESDVYVRQQQWPVLPLRNA